LWGRPNRLGPRLVADTLVTDYAWRVNVRAKRLLDEVLELPVEERHAFAAKLLENLEAPPDTRTDAEWAAEIDRRAREAAEPGWKGHSWEEVRAEVERSLRASRG
jgi:putative addiction module component (TIGR02574 family)